MKNKLSNVSIVFLIFLLFFTNLINILPLSENQENQDCERVNYFMTSLANVEIEEVSIYPEFEKIKCLGKIKDNKLIKSQN